MPARNERVVSLSSKSRDFLWVLPLAAVVLTAAAWLRGAEYDEQYTLFLTAGVPRPDWPVTPFLAGLARTLQSGHASLTAIATDLRVTDVHPPLYFWLVALWRRVVGQGLFEARSLSVLFGLGSLALIGVIAARARVPPARAMLLTLGCYGFTYTSVVARGFALAELLLLAGVACLVSAPRAWRLALAGALFGAATLSNYLAVFTAGAFLLAAGVEAVWRRPGQIQAERDGSPSRTPLPPAGSGREADRCAARGDAATKVALVKQHPHPALRADLSRERERCTFGRGSASVPAIPGIAPPRLLGLFAGFLIFIPPDLWWFLAQRGSRAGQFPPFSLGNSLGRLVVRFSGDLLGGLPLYVPGAASMALTAVLAAMLVGLVVAVVARWRRIGVPRLRAWFAAAALAPPVGLLLLGFVFNNTPIEVRYLTFSSPFVGLLLAGALTTRDLRVLLAVQAAAILGLMAAPQTMQPAQAAARAAAALGRGAVVLLPRGNDGVGVVGAFAIESPPDQTLLLIGPAEPPTRIAVRIAAWRRVVLAMLEQDAASRAASAAMRCAMTGWREVARGSSVAVYERGPDSTPRRSVPGPWTECGPPA